MVDSVVGTTPKASLKRSADGSQAAVLKPTPKSRPAAALSGKPGSVLSGAGPPPGTVVRGPSSGPRSLVQSQGGKASSSHQQMEVEHIRDDDDDIAFGESVSTAGGIPIHRHEPGQCALHHQQHSGQYGQHRRCPGKVHLQRVGSAMARRLGGGSSGSRPLATRIAHRN